jgi:hypothetical protein
MDDIILIKKKNNPLDSTEIRASELLAFLLSNINKSTNVDNITKDDLQHVVEMIPDINKTIIENIMTIDEVYELKHPINITSVLNENDITKNGVIYYNPIMEKLRLKTSHGWQSVKLE